MNTKILEYILAIAEEGSVSRAAERFYLSQPALSIHLKKVESDIGTPLFDREKGKLALTPAGVLFINNAQLILHLEKQLEDELDTLRHKQQLNLNLLVDPPFYNSVLLDVLPNFQANHPNFNITVNSSNSIQAINALKEKRADAAICLSTTPQISGLGSLPLGQDRLVLVFPPNYQGQASAEGLPAALDAGLLPLLQPVGSSMRLITEECLAEAGVVPPSILEMGNFHQILTVTQSWPCFSYVPQNLAQGYQELGLIVSPPQKTVYTLLLYQQDIPSHGPIQEFLQRIVEVFRRFPSRSVALKIPKTSDHKDQPHSLSAQTKV